MEEGIESVDCPDVCPQYKAMVDYYTLEIIHVAQALMAVVEEVGCEMFRCTDGIYSVLIEPVKGTKDEADGGNPSTED